MTDSLPIALAVMTASDVSLQTAEAICAAVVTNSVARVYFVQSGPYLDNGRNQICRIFNHPEVKEHCSHLLMVDSDVGFHPDQIHQLYEACGSGYGEGRAMVSGIYYSNFEGELKPVVYDWTTNKEGLKTLEVIDAWDDGWPFWPVHHDKRGSQDPVIKVEATGAGFMMIRRECLDVLEAVHGEPQPFFDEPVLDGVHFGEDLGFCMRVKNAGFSVWAHREVEVPHYKRVQLGPQPQPRK